MGSYLESHLCPVCWKMGNSYGIWHQKPSCCQHKYFSEIQRYAIFSWWTFPFTVVYNTAGFYDKSKYYSVLGCKTFTFIRVNKNGGNVGNTLPGNLFSQWVSKVTRKKEEKSSSSPGTLPNILALHKTRVLILVASSLGARASASTPLGQKEFLQVRHRWYIRSICLFTDIQHASGNPAAV